MNEVDVLVIGAGIQGVGVLQAAAAAGYSALLVEERAPAFGTSSRSSKLIHGGLRYLETMQLALVRESLREREILLRIAPHLVKLVPFFIPVYEDTSRPAWKIRAGLSMYAALGGFGADDRFQRGGLRRFVRPQPVRPRLRRGASLELHDRRQHLVLARHRRGREGVHRLPGQRLLRPHPGGGAALELRNGGEDLRLPDHRRQE